MYIRSDIFRVANIGQKTPQLQAQALANLSASAGSIEPPCLYSQYCHTRTHPVSAIHCHLSPKCLQRQRPMEMSPTGFGVSRTDLSINKRTQHISLVQKCPVWLWLAKQSQLYMPICTLSCKRSGIMFNPGTLPAAGIRTELEQFPNLNVRTKGA